jgi:hypothetical protein
MAAPDVVTPYADIDELQAELVDRWKRILDESLVGWLGGAGGAFPRERPRGLYVHFVAEVHASGRFSRHFVAEVHAGGGACTLWGTCAPGSQPVERCTATGRQEGPGRLLRRRC